MLTLRCTKKLLSRAISSRLPVGPMEATTILGDWHATLIFARPQIVLCVNDRSRLPVFVPARGMVEFPERLRASVGVLLRRIGVPGPAIAREIHEMRTMVLAK